MKCPPVIETETARLKALGEYGLGSDRPLPSLDPVVQIAARMFSMPMAAINMIGSDHVFFAASVGLENDGVSMSRDVSFCAHAITQNDVMVVADARQDERFHDNPLVTGPANLRFYAGVPLVSPDGHALGALCVLDGKPHDDFSSDDCARLRELARMAADRLELRRIEISTEQSSRPFEAFAMNSPTAVVCFDANGRIIAWNDAAARLLGYDLADGKGRAFDTLVAERHGAEVRDLIARAVAAGSADELAMPTHLNGLRRDGTEFALGLSLFCWREKGAMVFNAHLQDVSEHRREQEELHRIAHTDLLTGLANRVSFYRRTEETLTQPLAAAVLMVGLDGFKDVNDTLGHGIGDGILREVALRLEQTVGVQDTVARIGGDEFAVLLAGVANPVVAIGVAREIIGRVAEPIEIDGQVLRVAASCGVAVAPEHAQEAAELIGDADLALFKAKSTGRGHTFLFVTALRMDAVARRLYSIELHRAANDGEFVLFYQPQVRLRDGALVGAEALIRWHHPRRGLLTPAAFLPALEGGPLAATVGAWVIDEACAQAALWCRGGKECFRMGVNLCAAQFRVGDLVAQVVAALERHGLPPEALELEITENIVLDHDDLVLTTLERLHALGIGIAFDDFGTGYASLSLLKRYPLSRIKIDRSFVQGILDSERDASVVRAILDMASSFKLETIAEGVEDLGQMRRLRSIGCEEGQGYLFGRPVSGSEFTRMFGMGDGERRAGCA